MSWSHNLSESEHEFMSEIIAQIPDIAQASFVGILEKMAAPAGPSKEVQRQLDKLQALENGGVDNWEWYDQSLEDAGWFDEEDEED